MNTSTIFAALLMISAPEARTSQDPVVLSTDSLQASFSNACLVSLKNTLTGEEYFSRNRPEAPLPFLTRNEAEESMGGKSALTLEEDRFTWAWQEAQYSICKDLKTQSLLLTQQAATSRKGLSGVGWSLEGLDGSRVEVIVPGLSGVCFSSSHHPQSQRFSWPLTWEAAMVVVQGEKGGFWIWCEDASWRFKELEYVWKDGQIALRFETRNDAPYEDLDRADSVVWRLAAFEGDWRVPAGQYRSWMEKAYRLTRIEQQTPSWAKDISFLVIMGMQKDLLKPLASRIPASSTLLYIPGWRKDGYDKNYPDYTASPEFSGFAEEARSMGFHLMPHMNYFGCDPKHPEYDRFKGAQILSAMGNEPQWWIWPQDGSQDPPPIKFAYIEPGYEPWRSLVATLYPSVAQREKVDALHLDQTLCILNNGRKRLDRTRTPQGNLLLHEGLRRAVPEVALSGEGLDEVTVCREAFAQRHVWGIDHTAGSWEESFIACGHPISSYLFLPYCRIYGYLGFPNPSQAGLYRAWVRAYESWGVIPTLASPMPDQLENPTGDTKVLLELARLWSEKCFKPDWEGPWAPDLKLRLKGTDGSLLEFRRLGIGGSMAVFKEKDGTERVLYRLILGQDRISGSGNIPGWLGYDEKGIFGLDPSECYLALDEPRDLSGFHIAGVSEGVRLGSVSGSTDWALIELKDPDSGVLFDFCRDADQARTGILRQGQEMSLMGGASFTPGAQVCGQVKKTGLFAHPPWQGAVASLEEDKGSTFGEYEVKLPKNRPATLSFFMGLRQGSMKSDGVTFKVEANGREIFKEHWKDQAWKLCTVDLASLEGKRITLRFTTLPGPAGDVSFDWACWGEPVIRTEVKGQPAEIKIFSPAPILKATSSPAVSPLRGGDSSSPTVSPLRGGDHRGGDTLRLQVPSTLCLLYREGQKVDLPLKLTEISWEAKAIVHDTPCAELPLHACVRRERVVSAGRDMDGLFIHPPNDGRTLGHALLQLPQDPARLTFQVAIRDGSRSQGATFLVLVNGQTEFEGKMSGPQGWLPAEVDLSPYAGQDILLTLGTDSQGPYDCDWCLWGDPQLVKK